MYIPLSDTLIRVLKLTPTDLSAIRRGRKTIKALIIGVGSGIAADPNFISYLENPQKGAIVAAVVTAVSVTMGKYRRSAKFQETGQFEESSSEAAQVVSEQGDTEAQQKLKEVENLLDAYET